jgi:hypothetical protein
LDTLSDNTPNVTPELIALVEKAWLAYLSKQLSKGLEEKSIIVSGQEDASWQKIKELAKDNAWVQAGNSRDEKFSMHLKALVCLYFLSTKNNMNSLHFSETLTSPSHLLDPTKPRPPNL